MYYGIMKKEKMKFVIYEAPDIDVLDIRSEGCLCQASVTSNTGSDTEEGYVEDEDQTVNWGF